MIPCAKRIINPIFAAAASELMLMVSPRLKTIIELSVESLRVQRCKLTSRINCPQPEREALLARVGVDAAVRALDHERSPMQAYPLPSPRAQACSLR